MIFRVIIGFIIAIGGFLIVWKSEWLQQNAGSIAWAEEKMGSMGGSRMMYKLIGLAFLLIGFLAITNLHKQFFLGTVGRLLIPAENRNQVQYEE